MANSLPSFSRGIWNLSVLRTTDNICRKINDEKWFTYKKKLAYQRAEKAIGKVNAED
jgi:hypothetical protein